MKHPFQAVVIRVTPDATSGESLNIGVVMHAPAFAFFDARVTSSFQRITEAFPAADAVHLRRVGGTLVRACEGTYGAQLGLESLPIDVIAAVRRVLPDDDSGLVLSTPISGLTGDPARTLGELFARFVVRGAAPEKLARDDDDIWRKVATSLREHRVLDRLEAHVVKGRHYALTFENSWKNGHWNAARSLSFDLREASDIVSKAANWSGRIRSLDLAGQDTSVVLVIGLPPANAPRAVRAAAKDALGLLNDQLVDEKLAEVMVENDAPKLAARIAHDLEHRAESDD